MKDDVISGMHKYVGPPLDKIIDKLGHWYAISISMIPNFALAIILALFFFILARFSKKFFSHLMRRVTDNQALHGLFTSLFYGAVLAIGFFVVLNVLKLEKTVTSLLAGIGVIGLALGFAFQDIAANFVSGIILAFRSPVHPGNLVQIGDTLGTVQKIDLRVTVLRTFQGQQVYIPNKQILQQPIINYSHFGKRRVDLQVGVSYGDDLQKVEDVVVRTLESLPGVIKEEPIKVFYQEFGDSSINFLCFFWIQFPDPVHPMNFFEFQSVAIKNIKKAFDQEDITIPFPIRTLDFGIKGGEKYGINLLT